MWVCRAGRDSRFFDLFLDNCRIYLPWNGFDYDLSSITSIAGFRHLVEEEIKTSNRVTITNLASQLNAFCNQILIDDYVLIPSKNSRSYTLCRVTGNYEYNQLDVLHHSRSIELLKLNIPRDSFPKMIQYSLGAYRTVFRVKSEEEVLRFAFKQ